MGLFINKVRFYLCSVKLIFSRETLFYSVGNHDTAVQYSPTQWCSVQNLTILPLQVYLFIKVSISVVPDRIYHVQSVSLACGSPSVWVNHVGLN